MAYRIAIKKVVDSAKKIARFVISLTWCQLSALRTTGIFKIGYAGTVVVPVYSQALVFTGGKLSPSLFLLFLGSIILATAHLLNEVLCPVLIKEHRTLSNYRCHLSKLAVQRKSIDKILCVTVEKLSSLDAGAHFKKESLSVTDTEKIGKAVSEQIGKFQNKAFWDSYGKELVDHEDKWKKAELAMPIFRISILALYIIAASILLYILAKRLCLVFTVIS